VPPFRTASAVGTLTTSLTPPACPMVVEPPPPFLVKIGVRGGEQHAFPFTSPQTVLVDLDTPPSSCYCIPAMAGRSIRTVFKRFSSDPFLRSVLVFGGHERGYGFRTSRVKAARVYFSSNPFHLFRPDRPSTVVFLVVLFRVFHYL